jgi:sigma-B regulation protein RsbU (phosphoserine phosphatase)
MTLSDLQHFRDLLLEREQNLDRWLDSASSAAPDDIYRVQALVGDIKQALGRIENGSYGTCSVCKESVEMYRLEVQPAAVVCLGCISQEEKNKLEEELHLASQIHRALLPQSIPKIEGIEVGVKALAARSVGGDYYDFLPSSNGGGVRVVIADTMGKGIPAGLLMANIQGALRILAGEIESPGQLVSRLNQWLCRNIPVTNFISLVCLQFQPGQNRKSGLTYANAGHCPPVLLHADGQIESLDPTGGVLGVHEGFAYTESAVQLESGDLLLLYTDGVTEALNSSSELFGDERLQEYLKANHKQPVQVFLPGLLNEIHHFTGKKELDDDLTVIALKKL